MYFLGEDANYSPCSLLNDEVDNHKIYITGHMRSLMKQIKQALLDNNLWYEIVNKGVMTNEMAEDIQVLSSFFIVAVY